MKSRIAIALVASFVGLAGCATKAETIGTASGAEHPPNGRYPRFCCHDGRPKPGWPVRGAGAAPRSGSG